MTIKQNNTTAYNSSTNPGGMDDIFTKLLAEAQFAMYEQSIARQLVTAFSFPANAGKVLQVPVYSGVTAVDFTEGTAPSTTHNYTSSVDITLGEAGTYFQVTDFLRDTASRNVVADLGLNAGRAIAEKMDSDVFALFNSFSSAVGTEDAAITVDHIFEAVATLRESKVTGPLYGIISPNQALELKKALYNAGGTVATAGSFGNGVLERGYIGTLAGVQLFESTLVKQDLDTDADATLNAVGAIFAPSAIGHAMRGGINMERQRQAAMRAEDIVMTAVYGQAILQNSHGVKLTTQA